VTLGVIAPLFIVESVPASLAFYRDLLGFTVTFEGPTPDDIFFGMVERDHAMLMFKAVGVPAVPNRTRDVGQGIASWDAYCFASDPDALAAEFAERGVSFHLPLHDNSDRLRGFEVQDPDGYIVYFGRPIAD
jgi:catechol 2,3-dioxygenase-like lactoylglutathione lyase family enzyme